MRKCEVGGQAVIEGVMMRGSKGQATAIRKSNGKIEIEMKKIVPITRKYKFLNIPFIRGIFVLIDSLITGIDTLNYSASFFDEDEQYSCDMIILNGKIGYRYNKHGYGNIDHLTFEETKPNLENEVTLMLDMQEKLNKFINEELVYDIEMNHNDIKI